MTDLTDELPEHFIHLTNGELETVIEVLLDRNMDKLAAEIGERAA